MCILPYAFITVMYALWSLVGWVAHTSGYSSNYVKYVDKKLEGDETQVNFFFLGTLSKKKTEK